MTRNKKLVKLMAAGVAVATIASSMPAMAAFDADFYAKQNPDVVAAVGTSSKALENHYNLFGKNEGRMSSADDMSASPLFKIFDAAYYAKQNPDVANVFGSDPAKLFQHFMIFGMKEGRNISPYFDVQAYKAAYPDLQKAFGDNLALYYQHFATAGIKEHRTAGGFPAENILPSGAKVVTAASSGSSGGGSGSSGGGSAPSGGSTAPSGGSGSSAVVPKSIEGVTAANKSVEDRLAKLDKNNGTGNPEYEFTSEADKVALVNDAKAALQTANAVKEEKAAALETAKEVNKAADERLTEAAAAVTKAGLSSVGATEAAALKTANEAYYGKGTGTGTDAGAKAELIAAQKAKAEADADLQTAQSNYDKAVAAQKTALDNAYTVLTGVCEVPKNMINEQDPTDVTSVLNSEAAKLATAEAAVDANGLDLLDDENNIDSTKVKNRKDTDAATLLTAYKTDYLSYLTAAVKAGAGTNATDAQKTEAAQAEAKLKSIYGAKTVTVDTNNAVVIEDADGKPISQDVTKITASHIGTWKNTITANNKYKNKDLATATDEAKADIDADVKAYNKAQAATKAKTDLGTAQSDLSDADKALNGDTANGVAGAKKDASDAATALTEAQKAEAKAAEDITKAQAELTKAYNDATVKNEDGEDVPLSSEQKAILAERDAAQTEVIKTEYDERVATKEDADATAAANKAQTQYNTIRNIPVATPTQP